MKNIFVINGKNGVGKDQFIEFIDNCLTTGIFKVHNISTIDKIRPFAHEIAFEKEKTEKVRIFMQKSKELADDLFDHSFKYVCKKIDEGSLLDIYFIHCRESKNIKRLKNELGAKTILIKRDSVICANNSSDKNVENYDYDYTIENNGSLDEFKLKAQDFYNLISNGVN